MVSHQTVVQRLVLSNVKGVEEIRRVSPPAKQFLTGTYSCTHGTGTGSHDDEVLMVPWYSCVPIPILEFGKVIQLYVIAEGSWHRSNTTAANYY